MRPYDLDLFLELNNEYASKRIVKVPPNRDRAEQVDKGYRRAKRLVMRHKCEGQRVLEIGCGRGETISALATEFGCECVGLDPTRYEHWDSLPNGVQVMQRDITHDASGLGDFDLIFSFSVWEHIRHPFTMLKQVRSLLRPNGAAHISAQLYRGSKASHRYREVFFPWPHLLFSDDVFFQFYETLGMPGVRAAWVNCLSIADYRRYFELAGFRTRREDFSITPIDEAFYERFSDILERYPRFDLEREFIRVELKPLHPPHPNRLVRWYVAGNNAVRRNLKARRGGKTKSV
jgi:SAM-dependent methyltransferase